jgi:transcriptional regulator with XRE-family HTH domain
MNIMRRQHAVPPSWGRALIKAMGWSKHLKTQTALARRSGVAQSTIGRILRGEVDPQSGNLHRLARALGMPLTALAHMVEDGEMQAAPAIVSERVGGDAMCPTEEIDHALVQALACREDRKHGEQALESLRCKENDAIERLQELVRAQQTRTATKLPSR